MFTGLIECTAVLTARGGGKIAVRPGRTLSDLRLGASIAVNGCCLTLEKHRPDGTLAFHTLDETLRRTNLGQLPLGSTVNLEPALRLGDRLDGHLVSGHVDAVGRVVALKKSADDPVLTVEFPPELAPFLVDKGSIALDGVSLTLVDVGSTRFTVHLIPTTLTETALADRGPGDPVNLETDLIGKYVVRQLELTRPAAAGSDAPRITAEMLRDSGFEI